MVLRRRPLAERTLLLGAAFLLGTVGFGWWSVPVIGAAWGLVGGGTARPASTAGLAAVLAWAALLAWSSAVGPLSVLINKLGAVAQVPGAVFVILTLVLPFALAGSAAAVTSSIRPRSRPAVSGSGWRDLRP